MWDLMNEPLLLLATIVAAIAALPPLVEFLLDRRKRKERLALSIEDEPVADLRPRVAGMDELIADNADLIDRARDPEPYKPLTLGNEILILGPPQNGKRTLAQLIAREARFDRVVTVYNPRNKDALTKAKSLIHGHLRRKVLLLIPHVDGVFDKRDEDLMAELDALIETTTGKDNVLVVGTATSLDPDSDLDNLFGTKIVLPGAVRAEEERRPIPEEARRVLAEVTRFYLKEAVDAGFVLSGISTEDFVARLLVHVGNPAEVEDILALCRTRAIHRLRLGRTAGLEIDADVLAKAVSRVLVNVPPPPRRNSANAGNGGA